MGRLLHGCHNCGTGGMKAPRSVSLISVMLSSVIPMNISVTHLVWLSHLSLTGADRIAAFSVTELKQYFQDMSISIAVQMDNLCYYRCCVNTDFSIVTVCISISISRNSEVGVNFD